MCVCVCVFVLSVRSTLHNDLCVCVCVSGCLLYEAGWRDVKAVDLPLLFKYFQRIIMSAEGGWPEARPEASKCFCSENNDLKEQEGGGGEERRREERRVMAPRLLKAALSGFQCVLRT